MFHTPDFIKKELTRSQMNAAIAAVLAGTTHNSLTGLQGGTPGEYYHLTAAQQAGLTGGLDTSLHLHDIYLTAAEGNAAYLTIGGTAVNSSALLGGTWAIPGSIGITTPNAGAFTTLSANAGITGNVTGNVTGSSGSTTGNALTATTLQTPRLIGGISFNGSTDIVPITIGITTGTSLDLTGTLNVQGNTTLGDTVTDTLTTNLGVWTVANNITATRTIVAAGTQRTVLYLAEVTGSSGTDTRAILIQGRANSGTYSGVMGLETNGRHASSGTAQLVMGTLCQAVQEGTGNIVELMGVDTLLSLTNTGSILTEMAAFRARAPGFASTGTTVAATGLHILNQGNAKVTTARGVWIADFTNATTMRGIQSSLSSGTNKHNLYSDGTAPSYHEGDIQIGNATARTIENANKLQITGTTAAAGSLGISKWSADTLGARIELGKSRGAAIGTATSVVSGDRLASITAYGANGSTFDNAASIIFKSDGTPGASADMPGSITLATCSDGSATLTDRWIVKSTGALLAGTDNSWDIGAAGATRPRTGYFGTSVLTSLLDSGAASAISIDTNTGTKQVEIGHTASASRYLKLTGSNGGNPTIDVSAGDLAITPNIVGAGSIKTAAPNTGTAGAWKLGSLVGGQIGLVVIATQYIELDIGGTLYKLATV